MPKSCLCEQGFLILSKVNEKSKLKDIDPLMRADLETGLKPRFSQLVDEIQR